jgi:hypothetical protein
MAARHPRDFTLAIEVSGIGVVFRTQVSEDAGPSPVQANEQLRQRVPEEATQRQPVVY